MLHMQGDGYQDLNGFKAYTEMPPLAGRDSPCLASEQVTIPTKYLGDSIAGV